MFPSQDSSCGRWTQDSPLRRPGCRLGTGWWLWLGKVWRAWATRRRCPGSGRRARASPSRSSTLRLTASSEWCEHRGRGCGPGRNRAGLRGGGSNKSVLPASFQVRLSPLLFLESTEAPASAQETCSASPVETKELPVEDTALPPVPDGSRPCLLYPGPDGGYGFRLGCVASEARLFISQVTWVPWTLDLSNYLPPDKPSSTSLPRS